MVDLVLSTRTDVNLVDFVVPEAVLDCNRPEFLAFHAAKFRQFATSCDWATQNRNFRLLAVRSCHAKRTARSMHTIDDCQRFVLICCTNQRTNPKIYEVLCSAVKERCFNYICIKVYSKLFHTFLQISVLV